MAVKVSTTTAGFYPNTATITDSGTPPDPNTGNNTLRGAGAGGECGLFHEPR